MEKAIYVLIFCQLLVAILVMDYQRPLWQRGLLIILLVVIAIASIVVVVNNDKEYREMKNEYRKMKESLSQIELYIKEKDETRKTYAKKSEKTYPKDKTEAKIMIGLKGVLDIIESYNIIGVTDSGFGKIAIIFDKNFQNQLYEVSITGNKERIDYKITNKTTTGLSIEFYEEGLDWIQIICWER